MKIAYFDCFSGISGDMILGALLDAELEIGRLEARLRQLDLDSYEISCSRVVKQNIAATKFDLIDRGEKVYRHLSDLNRIIDQSELPATICERARRTFLAIAEAEARIHDQPLEKVHFHEVGAVDTIVDVVATLLALELLGIDKVVSSPLNLGSGSVEFSHGKFPVPAPATAEILKGTPVYTSAVKAELVTPTGAAIITTIADTFGPMPEIKLGSVGYGAGSADLPQPNVLRVLTGDLTDVSPLQNDEITVLETNIDDMNPQLFEHLMERLYEAGALECFLTSVVMKKSRPATQLTVLCEPQNEKGLAELIFRETPTLGIRYRRQERFKLEREIQDMNSKFGKVRVKISRLGDTVLNLTPEYEDCKRIAREQNMPLRDVYEALKQVK